MRNEITIKQWHEGFLRKHWDYVPSWIKIPFYLIVWFGGFTIILFVVLIILGDLHY